MCCNVGCSRLSLVPGWVEVTSNFLGLDGQGSWVIFTVTPYLGADAKDECDELMVGVNASCRKEGTCICKEPSAPVSQFLPADLVRGQIAIHDS